MGPVAPTVPSQSAFLLSLLTSFWPLPSRPLKTLLATEGWEVVWGQATLSSAWAEGTGQVPLLPTLGEEGLCPGQKGFGRTPGLSLAWNGCDCAPGALWIPQLSPGQASVPGVSDAFLSSLLALRTEFFCHLLSWGWSWEPRPSQESQGCWSGLSFPCR